jgi:flagellar motor component MotA
MFREGGHPGELLQASAFLSVIVGSLVATMVATLVSEIGGAMAALSE